MKALTERCVNLPERALLPEQTLIIPIASLIFSYFDTVYMCRSIPGPISMIYIFSLK